MPGQDFGVNYKIAPLMRTEPDVVVTFAATHAVATGALKDSSQVRREVGHGAAALATVHADELLFVPEKFDWNFNFRPADVHCQQFGDEGPQLLRHRFDGRGFRGQSGYVRLTDEPDSRIGVPVALHGVGLSHTSRTGR